MTIHSPPSAKNFGIALRAVREANGLSQAELAEEAGVTHTYISHIEAGRRIPHVTTVRLLATALGAGDSAETASIAELAAWLAAQ